MAPRLKVYVTTQGFYETAVAAGSQVKALAAWGTHQDLFAAGMARVSDDPAAVKAALDHPGEVVQRPAAAGGAFEPAGASALPDAPKPSPGAKVKPKPKSRKALDKAEAALADLAAREAEAEAAYDAERAALEERHARQRERLGHERERLEAAVKTARATYES